MAGLQVSGRGRAEFIHGEAKVTYAPPEARRASLPSTRPASSAEAGRGRLRPMNAFFEAQRAVQGVELDRDVSFDAFLRHRRLPRDQDLRAHDGRGFDAAIPRLVSAQSIIEEWARRAGQLSAAAAGRLRRVIRLAGEQHRGERGALAPGRGSEAHLVEAHVATVSGSFGKAKAPRDRHFAARRCLQPGLCASARSAARCASWLRAPSSASRCFHEPFWKNARGVWLFHSPGAPFPAKKIRVVERRRELSAAPSPRPARSLTSQRARSCIQVLRVCPPANSPRTFLPKTAPTDASRASTSFRSMRREAPPPSVRPPAVSQRRAHRQGRPESWGTAHP